MSEQNKTKEEPKKKLFNYVMSNPPYQETVNKVRNIDVWPDYVKATMTVADKACLIHPARWIVPTKTMRGTRDDLVAAGLKDINHYPDASMLFPRAAIDAGVSETYFESGYAGPISYFNEGEYFSDYNSTGRFVANVYEKEIVEKLLMQFDGKPSMMGRAKGNFGLSDGEFGYKKTKHIEFLADTADGMKEPVKVWANPVFGRGSRFRWMFIERSKLENIPDGLFDSRKVMVDKKGNALASDHSTNIINNVPQIIDKDATVSYMFLFFPDHDTDYELQLIKSMFMTKTVRFLMTLTQKNLHVQGFENIPDYTLFIPMLNGGLFTDEFFYKTFNFSQELIDYIEFHISPKTE